ncbi:MAG: OsmC family protein [Acutalibacteraceae bacterium]
MSILDVAKERGGKAEAFRPHEFLCAAYASCFHITYANCWIKKIIL